MMRHHQVEIECESGNTADIVRHVEHGLLDVGFVEGDVHNLAVEITPLAKESLVIVTADKALAEAGPYPIEALLDRHWLLREPGSGTRETFLRQLTPRGLRPQILLEFEHNDSIKQVLHNPGMLSCLSPRIVQREVRAGELFIVGVSNAQFDRTIYRVEHKALPFSSLREALSKEVESCLEEEERLCHLVLKTGEPLPEHEKEGRHPERRHNTLKREDFSGSSTMWDSVSEYDIRSIFSFNRKYHVPPDSLSFLFCYTETAFYFLPISNS